MEKNFIIHWRVWSNLQQVTVRNGYTVIPALNRRAARTKLRKRLTLDRGEKIVVDNIIQSHY